MEMLILFTVLALIGALAARYGADSRVGREWHPGTSLPPPTPPPGRRYTVSGDIAALRRAAGRARPSRPRA